MAKRVKGKKKVRGAKPKHKPGLIQRGLANPRWGIFGGKLVARNRKAKPQIRITVDEAYRQLGRMTRVVELTVAHADLLELMSQMNRLLVQVKAAQKGQAKSLVQIRHERGEIGRLARKLLGKSSPIAIAWKVALTEDLLTQVDAALASKSRQKELAVLETYLIQNLRGMSVVNQRLRKITGL